MSQPPSPCPAPALFQDLLLGRDTVAGLARRHGLPAGALLAWPRAWERESLLMGDAQPLQSRLAGPA